MKLAISNLSWGALCDDVMYNYLKKKHIALEVAPARIMKWEEHKGNGRMISPYERIEEASYWANIVTSCYETEVAAMEDLLFNVDNNMFANSVYRRYLLQYLKDAVNFAVMLKCPNVVFGCASNRNIPGNIKKAEAVKIAKDFFTELAEYTMKSGVTISLEPISEKEGTNFLNGTDETLDFVREIDKPDIKITVNIGTVIANNENISDIINNENKEYISHVHISEPGLEPIQKRDLHFETAELLKKINYEKYVSVEMKQFPDVRLIQGAMNYFKTVFTD